MSFANSNSSEFRAWRESRMKQANMEKGKTAYIYMRCGKCGYDAMVAYTGFAPMGKMCPKCGGRMERERGLC